MVGKAILASAEGKNIMFTKQKKDQFRKEKKNCFQALENPPKWRKKNSKQSLPDNTQHNFDTDFKGTQNVNQKP